MQARVHDAWNGDWNIPVEVMQHLPQLFKLLDNMTLLECVDEHVSMVVKDGILSHKSAKCYLHE